MDRAIGERVPIDSDAELTQMMVKMLV